MSARRLGGREAASEVRAEVSARMRVHLARGGRPPHIVAFAIDPDGGSRSYLEVQARAAASAGLDLRLECLDGQTTTSAARDRVAALCADPEVDGVLFSWPLPRHLEAERVLEALDPAKDVDAISTACLGRLVVDAGARAPATARAVMTVLAQAGADFAGARVTLVGKGRTAGLPTLMLLLHAGLEVTVVHRKSHDVRGAVREADIVISAAGSPGLIRVEDIKPGAIVVDVGTTEVDGKLMGDVEPGAEAVASAITPVPSGVGPVTIAHLLKNALGVVGA